jgi:DNA ligase 4
LFLTLFNPLNENKKRPARPTISRKKQGPHGPVSQAPHEIRRSIIDRFISRWRKEVGNDIYPAFRLIVPEKDRDRAMYGMKEKAIAKILIKIMKINRDSEDGYNLLNWKLPGKSASAMAGDFPGRCYEVLLKRPLRTEVGNLTIGEVNEMLDRLSLASKENEQQPIFEEFYERMNPEEMMWVIRIILRQMKVGATERTFFDIWHPDAENLFNISSSLRRVCWELYDPNIRLDKEDATITLMQCFQPQLAAFQVASLKKVVDYMQPTEEDPIFWIEEKLDGERMQLHMVEDESIPGGKRFGFWSRKAKEYTYLYGNGFQDDNSALTRHIKQAFHESVRNIILDGEMITWDMEQDAIVPFGTLKTAALSEQKNPFGTGQRPLFRVFDCLYFNDMALTRYTLRDRRNALNAAVKPVERRLEIHPFSEATNEDEIDKKLRQVVAEASEGLVIKNPRSPYRLNERHPDWIKVKPEYMAEFGEELDCIIIGGYYGSGRRGGGLSSFLCGLRVDEQMQRGRNKKPMLFWSFFKVGGGFTAADYATIRHQTDGKWKKWDRKRPPTEYIELGGGIEKQYEQPDVWIRPDESIVISVKAAQVATSDQFRTDVTLRFPRFRKIRPDKDWQSALTVLGWGDLKNNAQREREEKQFQVEQARKQRTKRTTKRQMKVAGADEEVATPFAGPRTNAFDGLTFLVITESINPKKMTKAELEQLIKANGGQIVQTESKAKICVAEDGKSPLKYHTVVKKGEQSIVRPKWIFDCVAQAEEDHDKSKLLLPYEPEHLRFATERDEFLAVQAVDEYNDSYARNVTVNELRKVSFVTLLCRT